MPSEVFPDKFFNLPNPVDSWVSIQFRTRPAANTSISDSSIWEDVTLPPSNHFQNMTIEDNAGVKVINLTLVDKTGVTLEKVLTKTILSTKLSNDLTKTGNKKVDAKVENETINWNFKINNSNMSNIRVRFGYSNMGDGIDSTDFGGGFQARASGQTVLRSPWIYLMIRSFKRTYNEFGLVLTIEGISITTAFLDTIKLVKRGMAIISTPEAIIDYLADMVNKASDGKIKVEIENRKDLVDATVSENGERYITINLGAPINETKIELRNLRSVFDEIKGLIPKKGYTIDGEEIPLDPSGGEESRVNEIYKEVSYDYFVEDLEDGTTRILFHYPNPFDPPTPQATLRTYIWKEYGKSIVKNISVSSDLDFVALNSQVIIVDNSEPGVAPRTFLAAARTNSDGKEEDTYLGSAEEITEIIDNEEFGNGFVVEGGGLQGQNALTDTAARIMGEIIKETNQHVFTGTIELIGDPFFLFDKAVRPNEYLIKILILKPSYIDKNGKYINPELSNISGSYYFQKITHTISSEDGFSTTINIQRFPQKGDPPVIERPARRVPPSPPPGNPADSEPETPREPVIIDQKLKDLFINNLRAQAKRESRAHAMYINDNPEKAERHSERYNELIALAKKIEDAPLSDLKSIIEGLDSRDRRATGISKDDIVLEYPE